MNVETFDLNRVYNIDCLIGLEFIKDKSVDLIFTDLPFGTTKNEWDRKIPLKDYILTGDAFVYEEDYLIAQYKLGVPYLNAKEEFNRNKKKGLWTHFQRIIKDHGVILLWAQSPYDKEIAKSNPSLYRYEWIIEKTRATGHLNAHKMPLKSHENILVFYKKLPLYHPQMTSGHTPVHKYIKFTNDGSNYGKTIIGREGGGSTERFPRDILKFSWDTQKSHIHPTQKPVECTEYFIKSYTDQGMVVLDCCAGSLTTAIACINTERNYICFEKNQDIFNKGMDRLNTYKKNNKI